MRQVADAAGTVHQTISGWELRRVMQPNSPLIGKATMALCGQPAEVLSGEDPGWHETCIDTEKAKKCFNFTKL